jgi:DNA-binding SARP family transcriptional activator
LRSLECRAEILVGKGDYTLALGDAGEVVALEPFRETGYQLLMRAHAGAGNPAEALRVYERCRALLAYELGASPSAPTEALYLEILRSS